MSSLKWKATPYGDYEAAGFVIVRQVYGRSFALYKTFPTSNQARGDPYKIGSLEECQRRAEELLKGAQ